MQIAVATHHANQSEQLSHLIAAGAAAVFGVAGDANYIFLGPFICFYTRTRYVRSKVCAMGNVLS
jgi:hypothetical protein